MRKIFVVLASMLLVILCGCTKHGDVSTVQVYLDPTERFSEDELTNAADVVKKRFADFEDCELQMLRYDEELQTEFLEKERVNTPYASVAQENILILTSTFSTGENVDASLTKGTTYENWVWILERADASSPWIEKDHGHLS